MVVVYKVSKQINQKLIKEISLFDVYEGKNLPKNKKSYGISFKMQDNEKTLSEAEIESVMSNITSKLKKEFNSKIQNLRIQIYSGDRENAEQIIQEFNEIFNDTTADVIYETPNYKVWVGNYYTQLEADKRLVEIRKKFRSAFIFRPEFQEIIDDEVNEQEDQEILNID